MRTKVHFVMPCHVLDGPAMKMNNAAVLALMSQMRVPFKITIINDGSPYEDAQFYFDRYQAGNPLFQNLSISERNGFSTAVNLGWKHALKGDAEYISIISNDVFVFPDWWEYVEEVFDRFPDAGLVIPTTSERSGRHHVSFNDGVTRIEEVLYAPFYLPTFRREVIEEVGYLDGSVDPILNSGSSDCDYMIRMLDTKWRTFVAREAFCQHSHHATIAKMDEWEDYQKENLYEHEVLAAKWGVDKINEVLETIWTPLEGGENVYA